MPALRATVKQGVMTLSTKLLVVGILVAAFGALRHRLGFSVATHEKKADQIDSTGERREE